MAIKPLTPNGKIRAIPCLRAEMPDYSMQACDHQNQLLTHERLSDPNYLAPWFPIRKTATP